MTTRTSVEILDATTPAYRVARRFRYAASRDRGEAQPIVSFSPNTEWLAIAWAAPYHRVSIHRVHREKGPERRPVRVVVGDVRPSTLLAWRAPGSLEVITPPAPSSTARARDGEEADEWRSGVVRVWT